MGKTIAFLIVAQGKTYTDVYEEVKSYPETAEGKQKLYPSGNTFLGCSSLN